MPRTARAVRAGDCYHVLNRGNARQAIFHKPGDYDAFCRVLAEGLSAHPVDLFAWCLMPNHWHLLLRPRTDDALGRLMAWVGVTHVRRHHEHYHTRGGGHLYQGRFKAFPVQGDAHFLTVARYVEANPLRAGLVARAEAWPWSSLGAAAGAHGLALAPWPVPRPGDWCERVNAALPPEVMADLRAGVNRGRPFGDPQWVADTAERLGLTHAFRGPGRPRKKNQ